MYASPPKKNVGSSEFGTNFRLTGVLPRMMSNRSGDDTEFHQAENVPLKSDSPTTFCLLVSPNAVTSTLSLPRLSVHDRTSA